LNKMQLLIDMATALGFEAFVDQDESIKIIPTEDKDIPKQEFPSDIIKYLNKVVGSSFKATTKAHNAPIRARLSEGYTIDDLKAVIDHKAVEWDDDKMKQYLRPSTLFGASKFDNYLSAAKMKPSNKMYEILKDKWED
jgi:uncharacterized phage protein (TIGR02220 family)